MRVVPSAHYGIFQRIGFVEVSNQCNIAFTTFILVLVIRADTSFEVGRSAVSTVVKCNYVVSVVGFFMCQFLIL